MRILVVDDVQDTTDSLVRSLVKAGHDAVPAYSEKTAQRLLRENIFDVVVTDMSMGKPDSGLEVLREAKKLDPHVEVILLTAYAEVKTAVPAMHLGAFDYIRKTPEHLGARDIYDVVLDKVDLALITRTLCDAFDDNEMAVLCLFLGFDYDELPRESKRDKVVHMVNQLSQDDDLHLLESLIEEIRPDLLGSRDCKKNATAIMIRIMRRALEYNPNIIPDVYNEMVAASVGQNRPKVAGLCRAVLSKSLQKTEYYEPVGLRHQSNLATTHAPAVAYAEDVYNISESQSALAPTRHAFLKVDVAEHSRIVKDHKTELVNQTFNRFESFVCSEITMRDGDVWSWQGDGGLCVFNGCDCEDRATLSAASILTGMQVFNMEQSLLPVSLDVCIAIHTGYVIVTGEKGSIHSEVINFVSSMEKNAVEKNTVCISNDVFGELSEQIKKRFFPKGSFEGKEIYVYGG